MKNKIPQVALVGRPNVGKSTLFNALINKRVAITHAISGVTHEGVTHRCEYNEVTFLLKDTGGITDDGVFASLIKNRSMNAIEEARVIIFMISIEAITAEDFEIADALRKNKNTTPVILVANKVDNEKREWEIHEIQRLGFGEALCVSALHKRNLTLLLDTISKRLSYKDMLKKPITQSEITQVENDEENIIRSSSSTRLLILGKPNTGKSSLVNCITGSHFMVSDIPGTTRDIAEETFVYENETYTLLDSAGVRRKNKIENDIEYYSIHRAIETIAKSHVTMLLVDVAEGFSEQDKKLVSLVIRRGRALIIALNKWDTIAVTKNRLQAEKDRLQFLFPHIQYAPVLPISARTGFGTQEIMRTAKRLHTQLGIQVKTPLLNNDVQRWVTEKTPPLIKGKRGKIKYVSQTQTLPPTFKVRVNNKKLFPEFYRLYIKNKIRKQYLFTEIPFHVLFVTNT